MLYVLAKRARAPGWPRIPESSAVAPNFRLVSTVPLLSTTVYHCDPDTSTPMHNTLTAKKNVRTRYLQCCTAFVLLSTGIYQKIYCNTYYWCILLDTNIAAMYQPVYCVHTYINIDILVSTSQDPYRTPWTRYISCFCFRYPSTELISTTVHLQ